MTLSVPSYVIPGTYAENLRFLLDKPEVEGVELLFYFWDAEVRDLLVREEDEIRSFSGRFRFTAHLPDRIGPEHRDILERVGDFARTFVVHPPADPEGLPGFAALLDRWRDEFGDRFFMENTRLEPFERALATLPDIPLCVDVGHRLAEGGDPADFLEGLTRKGRRVEELHIHGLADGADHRPFGPDAPWLLRLSPFLADFSGVAEVELFAWEEARGALSAVRASEENARGAGEEKSA